MENRAGWGVAVDTHGYHLAKTTIRLAKMPGHIPDFTGERARMSFQ